MSEFNPAPDIVASILKSPINNVRINWPVLRAALVAKGVHYKPGLVAALATIGVECRTFRPIHEYGGAEYFFKMYDIQSPDHKRREVAADLGNLVTGDGVKFHGRGYIQLTGRANYLAMSSVTGVDLIATPDAALEPDNAALIFAHYFASHGCDVWAQRAANATVAHDPKRGCAKGLPNACSECQWKMVRRKVNGGLNGYDVFRGLVDDLMKLK